MKFKSIAPTQKHKRQKRPICQFSLDGKFVAWHESLVAAGKSVGKPAQNIWTACNNNGCNHGFQWRYADKCERIK